MRARGTPGGECQGSSSFEGGTWGWPPPWGQGKGVPTSPALLGCLCMVPLTFPPCLHWLLCKKAMGCAGITRFRRDHKALPG